MNSLSLFKRKVFQTVKGYNTKKINDNPKSEI